MLGQILHLLQQAGYYLGRMNEQFYFFIDIRTNVSWAILLVMYALYKLLEKYFSDKELSSDELIRLIFIYTGLLLVIIASYTDLKTLFKSPNRDSSFMMFMVLILTLVVIIARLGVSKDVPRKKRWILAALYTPIIWIILTNGRVLEDRFGTFRNLMPRSNSSVLPLTGEMERLRVGGPVSPGQILKIQQMMNEHPAVKESALIARKDRDGLIKPLGLVVLAAGYSESDKGLKDKIIDSVYDRIADEAGIVELATVKILKEGKLPRSEDDYARLESILNRHPAVYKGVVTRQKDPVDNTRKPYAYVFLKAGYQGEDTNLLETDIRSFVSRETDRTRVSDYLYPRWIEFVSSDSIPKTDGKQVDYEKLQKNWKNWSELFRPIGNTSP